MTPFKTRFKRGFKEFFFSNLKEILVELKGMAKTKDI
jgi:hypothetical protein